MKNINYTALAIKKYIPRILWTKILSPLGRLLIAPYQFFWATGWLKSMWKGYACNLKGEHMPWLSMPAVEYLESIDLKGKTILELGGGSSTVYFARRGAKVYCLEQSVEWRRWIFNQMLKYPAGSCPPATMYHDLEHLVEELHDTVFDFILLDENPHDKIVEALAKARIFSKAIFIDNTEVPWRERGTNYINKHLSDMNRIDFTGFALGNCIQQTTSLYIDYYLTADVPQTFSDQPKVSLTNQKFKHEI